MITFFRILFGRIFHRRGRAVLVPPTAAEVERRLHAALWRLALRDRLPILLQPAARMVHDGTLCAGQYHSGPIYHVRIHEAYRDDPWVLAHELGHRRFGKKKLAHSEQDADAEAQRIVRAVLQPYELEVVRKKMLERLNGTGTVKVQK